MYQTSAEWKDRIYEDVENKLEIKLGNVAISEDDILELSIDCLLNDENVLSVGNTRAKGIDLLIYKRDYTQTQELTLRAGIKVIDKFEMIPMGTFIIDTWELEDDNTIRIKGSDYMSKFNFRYDASSLVPCTLDVILKDICTKAGVELAGNTADLTTIINVYDNTISAREYISYIAEQAGMNAFIGRDNKLYLKEFYKDTANVNIEYFGEFKFSDTAEISRVLYEDAIRKYEVGNNTKSTLYLNSGNPYIVGQEQVDNILALTQNKSVNGFSGKTIIDPAIDIGDKVVIDGKSTIFQGNLEFLGRWTATIENTIDTKARQENVTKITNAEKSKILKTEINENTQQITLLNKQINEIEGTQEVTQSLNGVKEAQFEADGGKLEQARFSGDAEQNVTKTGINLYDKNKAYSAGSVSQDIRCDIKVNPNTDYFAYCYTGWLTISFFDSEGNLTRTSETSPTLQETQFMTASNEVKIRMSFYVGEGTDVTKYDFTNVQLNLGKTKLPYEPYIPNSPSPDYPSPINVVDKINYSVNGKNLFDNNYIENSYVNIDGTIVVDNGMVRTNFIKIKPSKKISISIENKVDYIYARFFDKDKAITEATQNNQTNKLTYTPNEKAEYVIYCFLAPEITSLGNKTQIEYGEPSIYEPYQNFTQEILLPNGEFLAKIGDVSDELKEDGTIVKRIGKYEFSGEEAFYVENQKAFSYQLTSNKIKLAKSGVGISNYFIVHNHWANTVPFIYPILQGKTSYIRFTTYNYNNLFSTLEEFKNWLKARKAEGKPVIFYYPLAEERTAKLTAVELTKLQNLQVLKGENNLISNAYTYGNYTLTVPALYTLQEKLTQIDLNQDNISLLAKKTTTVEKQAEDNSKVINETKTQLGEIRVNQENIQLEVRDITDNGVSKVKNTLVNIDQEGMRVSKAGEEINTLISNTGMYVNDHDTNLLTADKNGVVTENLLVRTYANIGYHRFEKFEENGEKRTGCFFIG